MNAVTFSRVAEEKLTDIYYYIETELDGSEDAYRHIDKATQTALQMLVESPKIGRRFKGENVRFIVLNRYVFLYEIMPNAIVIADIYTAGENWR